MRWSKQFIPTLREVPQEAEIISHKLMLRAGLIRRLGAGLYTYLPLGWRALRKVEAIVREEMDRAGALEIHMPAMQPRELWEESGRWPAMQEVMFSMTDRQDRPMVLGPTHEEVVTQLAAREIDSYRQLPVNFYQVQTKFRDEIRPRFGLMRSKEFLMKDAYSFDVSLDAADTSYQAMYNAYRRIFARSGLRTKVVEADTGAIGGSSSHEFMVLAESGEDGIVECDACAYAANLERAERRIADAPVFDHADAAAEEVATPGARTIEEVAAFLKIKPRRLIKTLIYLADGKPVAVLVAGDRDINETKLARALGGLGMERADDRTIEEATGAPVGFAGPVGLDLPVYADARLEGARGMAAGANRGDTHILNVDLARDAKVAAFADLSLAREGDGCPRCDGTLREQRGIEVGHVFKLGTKYSEAMDAMYLDAEGQRQPAVMGCYGIGVSRTLQAVLEQSNDKDGVLWPISIAPYQVEVVVLNVQHEESVRIGEQLVADLEAQGIDVLYDDRDERPGVKFKDADLLGLPVRVAVGERSLARGELELKLRRDDRDGMRGISVDGAAAEVAQAVRELWEEMGEWGSDE